MNKNTKTLFISNIPTHVSPLKFRELFSDIGPLQRWFLTRDNETCDLKGTASISYTCEEDATKAVKTLNKTNFEGNIISVKFTSHKNNQILKCKSAPNDVESKCNIQSKDNLSRNKKGRLVIRNLSYKASEENLKEHFLPYGSIRDVCLLRYSDGKMKGVGFLEYSSFLSASQAVEKLNMKPFLGRPIAVDFAVPKHQYEEHKGKPVKKEPPDFESGEDDSTGIEMDATMSSIKLEKDLQGETEQLSDNKDAKMNHSMNEIDNEMESEDDDDDDENISDNEYQDSDDSENDDTAENNTSESPTKSSFAHNPVSKDVLEGKTIFIRNLSFSTTKEKVEEILSEFGNLKYVMFCKDKSTQRFTGSCFAQFMMKEECDACLEVYEDPAQKSIFRLDGRMLTISKAVGRNDLTNKRNDSKEKEKKDSRNLYLAREGVIREGTKAAFGASKSDLLLRTQREIVKRKMLMNYNIFISPIRLCIHNLPITLDDKELLSIFRANSPSSSVIKECRIMRNLYDLDDNGKPNSKCFGFVAFTKHEDALSALRNINNNPSIFTHKQRPVVEFSLENKAALKAKENRQKKSLSNNKPNKDSTSKLPLDIKSKEETPFMGATYDPNKKGISSLASHVGPKIRHRDRDPKKKISRNEINNQLRSKRRGKKKAVKGKKTPGKKTKKFKRLRA